MKQILCIKFVKYWDKFVFSSRPTHLMSSDLVRSLVVVRSEGYPMTCLCRHTGEVVLQLQPARIPALEGGWEPLHLQERPGSHPTGSWAHLAAGLDGTDYLVPTGIRSPVRPACSQSALSRPLPMTCRLTNYEAHYAIFCLLQNICFLATAKYPSYRNTPYHLSMTS